MHGDENTVQVLRDTMNKECKKHIHWRGLTPLIGMLLPSVLLEYRTARL
jgi:hypothetical protein